MCLLAIEFVVATKVEEVQTFVHCSTLDFLQGPGVGGVVVGCQASVLKQQRDQPVNLCGAVDPPGDVDLHCPGGVVLHIVPSKTDTERLLVISPELADVLSAIVCRVRDDNGAVPLVTAYDVQERVWNPPRPLLFQRRLRLEDRPITEASIRTFLKRAAAATGITDASGQPLHFAPHDLRRIFVTDAVMNGMPPHIAQL
ncbi:tyrosine-type recombinase/integrase, partial [Streptomyces sp. NPDC097610]|uniref:tyrosine-type recombinase/integrase n=1 Tax=Streptomyces sp. NPDC097610 TaxID=3157227 RepID=UPI003332010E